MTIHLRAPLPARFSCQPGPWAEASLRRYPTSGPAPR